LSGNNQTISKLKLTRSCPFSSSTCIPASNPFQARTGSGASSKCNQWKGHQDPLFNRAMYNHQLQSAAATGRGDLLWKSCVAVVGAGIFQSEILRGSVLTDAFSLRGKSQQMCNLRILHDMLIAYLNF